MIKIEQLEFTYQKRKKLFQNLNVNLYEGKVYGILGHNGAGKTTMLKLIAGLIYPKSGRCNVDSFIPKNRDPYFLQEIFYIPEEFEFPSISISKFIKIYSSFYPKFDINAMDDLLNEFELSSNSKINNLSFGQKKKLLIAFAISTNCKILLMDEPTNGLDIPSKSKFRKIIATYFNDDRLFIISTHQVRDLDNILDTLIVIEHGEVIFNRTTEEIQSNLSFNKVRKTDNIENILYTDKELGGYSVITKNMSEEETKIDIEVLYKAINSNKQVINEAFNNQ